MIIELFNWLHEDEVFLPLSNQLLSRDLLELEQSQANKTNRSLLSEVRLAKLSGLETSDARSKLEKHIVFMSYLEFCRKNFTEAPKSSLFLITLKYLLTQSQTEAPHLSAKLNELFGALLQEDRSNTLSFYQQNEELFKNHPDIQKRVELALDEQKHNEAVKRIERDLAHLSTQLSQQTDPLGIIRLCREWVSDTEQFAALILWLLQRNVSTEQILQTHLFHDFLKYHLFTLHSEDNEVFHLYALLARFPQAKQLMEAAKQTGSDERGFQHYALDGILSEKELQEVPQRLKPLQFSLTASNFLALHTLFGQPFLTAAVATSVEQKNAKWSEILCQTLNESAAQGIPGLINIIAREFSPQILENLAGLIDDHTAQRLLSNNEGAVFYLLPYKPQLFEYITEKNVTEFIHQISIRDTSDPEIIFQLMALFSMLPKKRNPITQLVFQAIIENLAQHPLLLDDEKLLRQLRKYHDCEQILAQQSAQIKQRVHDCMIEQTTEPAFSSHNYQIIEDVWLEATRKINVFELIKPQAKYPLNHKYALQTKIAEMAFLCHGDHFDLDAFIEALSLPPVNAENGASEYERILIEILAVIDNELLREQIIGKLEGYPVQRLDWIEKEYAGKTIFLKAAKQGNLGLVTFLKDQIAPEAFNQAIITAAKANHWKIVDFLCRIDKVQLNQDELEKLILLAAEQGQLKIIKYLLNTYDYELAATEIIKILHQAITNGKLNVVTYFYNSFGSVLNQSTINKLFNSAVESEYWDIVLFIAESEKHPPSLSAIEKAFNQAVNTMHLEGVKGLYHLSTNAPRPHIIQRAFVKSCKLGDVPVVQCLHALLEKLPPPVLEDALDQAVVNGQIETVSYLCNSPSNPPNQSSINQGLITAAKTGTIVLVDFFCSMTTRNRPTQNAVNQALYWTVKNNQVKSLITLCHSQSNSPSKLVIRKSVHLAVKSGKLGIVEYLCMNEMNSLNQRAVEEELIFAVKFKKPEIVRFLCELPSNSPGKKALRIALNRAVSSNQTDIASYLSDQLQHTINLQKTSDSEMDNISGIGSLSETGLEVERNPEMNSSTERVEDSEISHEPEVGRPLKAYGLFKVSARRDISPESTALAKSITLR